MEEAELFPRYIPVSSTYEKHSSAIEQLIAKYAQYAILSHTWLQTAFGEVTYGDWNKGQLDTNNVGYQKLVNFCRTAWRDHSVAFGWMDTVCINKDSSTKLDESIHLMYNWYQHADVCITYFANTEALTNMHLDPWFTCRWMLQELVTPDVIKFYNCDWNKLLKDAENDKLDTQVQGKIKQASTISWNKLCYIHNTPILHRMELAAKHQVTWEEDTAYSLMGIFNVSIATAYGKGVRSTFSHLLQEILTTVDEGILDIFNFAGVSGLYDNMRVLLGSPWEYTT